MGDEDMKKVDTFVQRHGLIKEGDTIVAAISGGPDSLALLHYLSELKQSLSLTVIPASIDHGLRGEESREDVAYVAEICERLRLPVEKITLDVGSYMKKNSMGTQEAARILRYKALAEVMYTYEADSLALGHHGDDQVETLFMQLTRGASPSGVTGMPVTRKFAGGQIIRPLLEMTKEELERYCRDAGLTPRYDPSNEETAYTRNAFRHRLIPFLKEQNPKLHTHIQAYSERKMEDETFLLEKASEIMEELSFSEGRAEASISSLQRYPIALQRRAFHLILNYLYNGQTENITYVHEDLFLRLMDGDRANSTLNFPKDLHIIREYDKILFTFEDPEPASYRLELQPGESVLLPGGDGLAADFVTGAEEVSPNEFICDESHVSFPLIVRTRRDGDRMKPAGMKGTKKIKDIFIDCKVPLREREDWPVVTDSDGTVLWIPGIKKAAVEQTTGSLIRVTYNRAGRRNEDA